MAVSDMALRELEDGLTAGSRELADLLAVSTRERQALVESDHAAFAACAEEKDDALNRFLSRQSEIIATLRQTGIELGVAAGEVTLSAITAHVPATARDRLTLLAREIEARLAALQKQGAENALLIGGVLSYYEFLVNLIIDTFSEQADYGPSLNGDRAKPIMMDQRA